jgi:hypothetical protein
MQGLQANLQSLNDKTQLMGLLTELRRQDSIDQRADKNKMTATQDRVTWDEWIGKGAAVGLAISGLADVAIAAGSSNTETSQYVDKKGNPISEEAIAEAAARNNVPTERYEEFKSDYLQGNAALDASGKAITNKVVTREQSGFAHGAQKVQNILGKILPGEGARIKASRENVSEGIKSMNLLNEKTTSALVESASRAQDMREMRQTVGSAYAGMQAIVASGISGQTQLNAELVKRLEDLQRLVGDDGSPFDPEAPRIGVGTPKPSTGASASLGAFTPDRWDLTDTEIDTVKAYQPMIEKYSAEQGVDPALMLAQMFVESGGNPRAVSVDKDGNPIARGLFQFKPKTAAEYAIQDPFDPVQSTKGATRYMKDLTARYGGDVVMALAAYNAGLGNVVDAGGAVPAFDETHRYLRRIHWYYQMIGGKKDHDFGEWSVKRGK